MTNISRSSNLFSHPGKLLEDHLIGVANLAEKLLQEKPKRWQELLSPYLRIAALTHDIAKATGYFQQYIQADEEGKKKLRNKPETKHAHLSAIVAYYVSKQISSEDSLMHFFTYLAVRRHHGNLDNVQYETIAMLSDEDEKIMYRQIESINDEKFNILAQKLGEAGLPARLNKNLLFKAISTVKNDYKQLKRIFRKFKRQQTNGIEAYVIVNMLFSLLIDADKSEVVVGQDLPARITLPEDLVYKFKTKVFSDNEATVINKLREQAYKEAQERIIKAEDERIFSLELPTGLGKTLTSLNVALQLRAQKGNQHRIIYSLPFLSIIDQNSKVFEEVFRQNGIEPTSSILLKHHHLSDIIYRAEEDEFEEDAARILIEGWNSEIIVTSFVQVFQTLVSNRNRALRKFHRFARSIIILDEVQAIPVKYWQLVRELLRFIAYKLDSYVILVTATQPFIFEPQDVSPLVNSETYFSQLNRIELINKSAEIRSFETLLEEFMPLYEDGKSVLFIMNTIRSAKTLYERLSQEGYEAAFLSSHLIPAHRLNVINQIKEGRFKLAVTTQLVEAGVDIDFDIVVRDFAPLDSIIQSAGRCNRNGVRQGTTYVVDIKSERNTSYASYIYDPVLLDITRDVLTQDIYLECEISNLIKKYYEEARKRKAQQQAIINAIRELKYSSSDDSLSVDKFFLIENQRPEMDVFIEWNDEAVQLWQHFDEITNISDRFERRKEFDKIKGKFYQYVISIPENVSNKPAFLHGKGYVSRDDLDKFYDGTTGFILDETETDSWII